MPSNAKKWLELLEEEYGVSPEFAGHVSPLLDRAIEQASSADECDQLLHGLAAAYRSSQNGSSQNSRQLRTADEVGVIADEFLGELRKMDESLKVLGAYLERLQQRAHLPHRPVERVLH